MRSFLGRPAVRAVLAAVAVVALAVFAGGPLFRGTVALALGLATGDRVAFDDLRVSGGRISASGIRVERGGAPLFSASRIDVRYDLRALLTGGAPRYGLERIELERPVLVLVRRSDGSFDLGGGRGGGPGTGSGGGGAPPPFAFTAALRDGAVVLRDPSRVLPGSRELALGALAGDATIDTGARSAYRGSGRVGGANGAPFAFAGRFDAGGYALHRVRAALVPVAAVANFFINTPAAAVLRGSARALDLRAYRLGAAGAFHVVASARLEGGAMHVPGLAVDATDMRGRVDAEDAGLATPRLDARLGPARVRLAGGILGWHDPQFRLGVAGAADLRALRGLFRFSRRLPLAGHASITTLLEGAVGAPLVATRVDAPALAYGAFPVERVSGRAVYATSAVDVVDARGAYGGIGVAANGAIDLSGPAAVTRLVVAADAPGAAVPYAAEIAPRALLHASALLAGTGIRFDASGALAGAGGGTTLAGTFHLDPDGRGAFGPLAVRASDGGRFAGTFYQDRPRDLSGFWAAASGMPYAAVPSPRLPGLDLAAPPFAAVLDGAAAGAGPPSAFRIAGRVRARALRIGGTAIDLADAGFSGAFGNVRLGAVAAHGAWGDFRGTGGFAAGRLALAGRYAGSFERLRAFTGDVGGAGPAAGPVALLIDARRTLVQARGVASAGSVDGVPVDGISGTVAVSGGTLRLYAATARVAGGDLAAAGTLGRGAVVGVSLAGADAGRTRAGRAFPARVSAIGTLAAAGGADRFAGGVAFAGARVRGLPVAANGDVGFGRGVLTFADADAAAGPAVGRLDGSVARLGSRAPLYDVAVHLPGTAVAPFVRLVAPGRRDVAGTLAGDLRARGTFATLALEGTLRVPEGTIGGLAFTAASARIALDRAGFRARDGRVTVGSTRTAFGATVRGGDAEVTLDAPHADLSDFNDLFDAGDTLGGRGRVDVRFAERGRSTRTMADIAIAKLRYRGFDLGDARAAWDSHGRDVRGYVDFGGASGKLAASGVLLLPPPGGRRERLLPDSHFDGTAELAGLDLGVWLPALGYQLPIDGRLDARATIAGFLRNPAVTTTAGLRSGSIGKFPVDRLLVKATSTLDRTTVTQLEVELPSVSIAGSGSFGLGPRSPVALTFHAASPSLGTLSARLFGAGYPVTGAADLDLAVDGTRAAPHFSGSLAVRSATVRGVAVPGANASFDVRGRSVVLRGAGVRFATGALALSGSVPLQVAPFGLGPASAPLDLALAANDVELAEFAPLLPEGSQLRGRLDGTIALGGTVAAPRLAGTLALTGGFAQTPLETEPLRNVTASLRLDGRTARLEALHASAGGGTLDASGSARFADLIRPGADATYDFVARADKLRLDLPAYGSGVVDGTLSLGRVAGEIPNLAGDLRLSDGTIPFSALLLAGGGGGGEFDAGGATSPAPALPANDVAFNLDVTADRNVRVRSANVDIGGRGTLHVGGSLAAPALDGGFTSTGGTITYFNTVFRLVEGKVAFEPDLGVIPTLDARAVTHVINPDPNTVRNLAGTADVTLSLSGPVTNLTIGLSSDPSYDRQQILGLLLNAPALGASNLFGENRDQPTPYGSNAVASLPPTVATFRSPTGEMSVAQEAFGVANAQFTRTLLAPIESTFAQAVGLSNFNVNVDYTGNVGVSARKVLGKDVNAIYGSTFGYPYRQTFGFELRPNAVTAAQVTVFETLGGNGLYSLTPAGYVTSNNPRLSAAQPSSGTAGFSLSLQRLF